MCPRKSGGPAIATYHLVEVLPRVRRVHPSMSPVPHEIRNQHLIAPFRAAHSHYTSCAYRNQEDGKNQPPAPAIERSMSSRPDGEDNEQMHHWPNNELVVQHDRNLGGIEDEGTVVLTLTANSPSSAETSKMASGDAAMGAYAQPVILSALGEKAHSYALKNTNLVVSQIGRKVHDEPKPTEQHMQSPNLPERPGLLPTELLSSTSGEDDGFDLVQHSRSPLTHSQSSETAAIKDQLSKRFDWWTD